MESDPSETLALRLVNSSISDDCEVTAAVARMVYPWRGRARRPLLISAQEAEPGGEEEPGGQEAREHASRFKICGSRCRVWGLGFTIQG
jgi:hypothetical protein